MQSTVTLAPLHSKYALPAWHVALDAASPSRLDGHVHERTSIVVASLSELDCLTELD